MKTSEGFSRSRFSASPTPPPVAAVPVPSGAGSQEQKNPVLQAVVRYVEGDRPATDHRRNKNARIESEIAVARCRLCGTNHVPPLLEKIQPHRLPDVECIVRIAVMLAGQNPVEYPHLLIARAVDLWRAAESASTAERQERDLLKNLFDLHETDWDAEIQKYEGDPRILAGRFERTFFKADFVLRNLFRNTAQSDDTRRKKFADLIAYAREIGLRLPGADGQHRLVSLHDALAWLNHGEIDVLTIRWLVVARQRQISAIRLKASNR